MGRCQTALRPDSHKSNHSITGQAVLHIRHPRNRPLRPGSKLQKQHRPEHIGCIWSTEKPYHTLYHPQGDGMVERFNRSLLQLLRTYVEKQEDWEQHLPLALYAYKTTTHTSTGMSPFQLMYKRHPQPNTLTPSRGYKATSYQAVLRQRWLSYRTWWRLTFWSLHTGRKWTTTGILQSGHSSPGTWCGCRYPQQASWICDGRGTGQ